MRASAAVQNETDNFTQETALEARPQSGTLEAVCWGMSVWVLWVHLNMTFGEYFEWDEAKEASNLAKHGVTFPEAVAAFADTRRVILPDLSHSRVEPRWHCVGRVGDGILTVRFTKRGDRVRILGAGWWRKGRRLYETHNQIR